MRLNSAQIQDVDGAVRRAGDEQIVVRDGDARDRRIAGEACEARATSKSHSRARKRAPPVRQQRDRADPISRSDIAATLRQASTPPSRARRLDSVTSVSRWPNPPGRLNRGV